MGLGSAAGRPFPSKRCAKPASLGGGAGREWNSFRMAKPLVRHISQVAPVPCPCGESRRLITRDQSPHVGLHVTHIARGDLHFHRRTTELYYILSGHGVIELDGEQHEATPGTAVHIPPGVKHRGWGDFETIVVTCPAFDAEDEFVAE